MEVCSGHRKSGYHEEIVYDERYCPLCAALERIAYLEKQLDENELRIGQLENERAKVL